MIATPRNDNSGKAILELLLSRDDRIEITELVLAAAAANKHCGKEIIKLLPSRSWR